MWVRVSSYLDTLLIVSLVLQSRKHGAGLYARSLENPLRRLIEPTANPSSSICQSSDNLKP